MWQCEATKCLEHGTEDIRVVEHCSSGVGVLRRQADGPGVGVGEIVYLYLPLAHNFGRLMHLSGPYVGYTTAFLPEPLEVARALPQVRPTVLPSVPRIYEKVHTAVTSTFAEATGAVGVLCLAFPLQPPRRSAGSASLSRLPELDAVTVPTLVVQGERDRFGMPPASSLRTVTQVPGTGSL